MLKSISLFENNNICVYMYIKGNINLVNMCTRIRDKSYAMLLGKCKWVVEGE